jgi:predicted metal-binding protein
MALAHGSVVTIELATCFPWLPRMPCTRPEKDVTMAIKSSTSSSCIDRVAGCRATMMEAPWLATSEATGHDNGCSNYGTTYGCPPHAPKLAAFKSILAEYKYFYLVYGEVELAGDPRKDKTKYADMQVHVDAFVEFLQDNVPGLFIIHGYGCHYCKRVSEGKCTCPDEPCRHPEKLTYSLCKTRCTTRARNALNVNPKRTISFTPGPWRSDLGYIPDYTNNFNYPWVLAMYVLLMFAWVVAFGMVGRYRRPIVTSINSWR